LTTKKLSQNNVKCLIILTFNAKGGAVCWKTSTFNFYTDNPIAELNHFIWTNIWKKTTSFYDFDMYSSSDILL